jgi:hypothetical protein
VNQSRVPPSGDRRRGARSKALLRGVLVFDHPPITVDCTIRDLTQSGARLVVVDRVAVPREGSLINIRDGVAYEVSVAWRANGEIGVSFGETIDLKQPAPSGPHHHLRNLWLACGGAA